MLKRSRRTPPGTNNPRSLVVVRSPMGTIQHRAERGWDAAREIFFRVAASGVVPAKLFLPSIPEAGALAARTGHLQLEIVSHCWNYDHLLAYQLTSLVKHPPARLSVTMTVFYTPE